MRRTVLLLLGALAAMVGVVLLGRLDHDRRYRTLMTDGDAALVHNQPYRAVEAFSGALAIRGDAMAAYYRRGEAYAALGQDFQAERDLRQAHTLAPDAPEPFEALGRLAERRSDWPAAADAYAHAADRLRDTDARLLYTLGLAHYRTGALPAASDALRRALAVDDASAEAHYLQGLIARDLGNTREALAALEQAIRLRPSFSAARQELAALYRTLGRTGDEIAQMKTLAAQDGSLDRHLALADSQVAAGQPSAALDTLAAAETQAPGNSRIALAVGRARLAQVEQGDPQALAPALQALERALGGTAPRGQGLALYGRALHLSGDTAGAERLLLDAIRTSPTDTHAFGYLADAAERLDHAIIARDALIALDALEGGTAGPSVRAARARRIGALSLTGHDPATAVHYLTLATTAGDQTPATRALLADAQAQAADAATASRR